MKIQLLAASTLLVAGAALAAPVKYNIDPNHTYPSFEADHQGGLSLWRGKFRGTTGTVLYDKAGKAGSVDITIDTASIDFGHDKMSEHAKGADMFDAAKYPTTTFKGKFAKFNGEAPTEVVGELTLHGITKPVTLTINSFTCRPPRPPMQKTEKCGADASATINRGDYGIDFGKQMGFRMDAKLQIQVEAAAAE
jgi:polyisoprenoid-binding protein YceI